MAIAITLFISIVVSTSKDNWFMKAHRSPKQSRQIRSSLSLTLLSLLITPFVLNSPTQAQTQAQTQTQTQTQAQTTGNIVADGRLDEYFSAASAPLLYQGLIGSAVTDIQYFLISQGFYRGAADGIFGPATYAAIVEFQRSNNITADGIIGPETWSVLFAADERVAFLRPSEPLL